MLLFLSPAKTFDETFIPPVETGSVPDFLDKSTELIDILKAFSVEEISSLMGVSEKIADLNFGRYKSWTREGHYHALWLFAGDVYRGMQAQDFTSDEVAFAQAHLRILSGLYGCLRPLDKIDPYRLEMGTKLNTTAGKNLYDFWGHLITDYVRDSNPSHLINLASEEYAKVLHFIDLDIPKIDVVFQEQKNGARKIVAIYAKKARGMMARFIIKKRIENPEGLKAFDMAGYQFDPEGSTTDKFIFVC